MFYCIFPKGIVSYLLLEEFRIAAWVMEKSGLISRGCEKLK